MSSWGVSCTAGNDGPCKIPGISGCCTSAGAGPITSAIARTITTITGTVSRAVAAITVTAPDDCPININCKNRGGAVPRAIAATVFRAGTAVSSAVSRPITLTFALAGKKQVVDRCILRYAIIRTFTDGVCIGQYR